MDNPFVGSPQTDLDDQTLVSQAQQGSKDALEELVKKHQNWVYNLSLRMLFDKEHAQEATQEILVKVVTKISSFKQQSAFKTWLYRVAVNHLLNAKHTPIEPQGLTFSQYGQGLDDTPIKELPDEKTLPVTHQILVEEAKIGCMLGMLLCLDRKQRMIFILGEMFHIDSTLGSQIMDITPANFRKLLQRARQDLYQFMDQKCGLIKKENPCRCKLKTQGFIDKGYVDPNNIQFAEKHLKRVNQALDPLCKVLDNDLNQAYRDLYLEHPFYQLKDKAVGIDGLFSLPNIKKLFDF